MAKRYIGFDIYIFTQKKYKNVFGNFSEQGQPKVTNQGSTGTAGSVCLNLRQMALLGGVSTTQPMNRRLNSANQRYISTNSNIEGMPDHTVTRSTR